MENLNIRQVTLDDLNICHKIESTCFLPSEAAPRESIEKRISMFPEGFLVAEYEGNIVGQINSGATNKEDITDEEFKKLIGHDSDGKNIVVFSLAVLPDYQKKGIAGQLMVRFVENSRNSGRGKVLLICKSDLVHYYSNLGFSYGGVSASRHGGFEWHEMAMPLV